MYILKTSYNWQPTGDRYEMRVEFENEKDANGALKTAFETADALMENELVGVYEIELIYMKTVYKTSISRGDV